MVGFALYAANPANHGGNFSWGEAALAAGVGALAGAAMLTAPGAAAAGVLSAGSSLAVTGAAIGAAANGTGYMVGNMIAGNEFESADFAIAAGVGAVSGALGPTTRGAATALGAASGFVQYEATRYAHTGEFALDEGALFSTSLGAIGGFVGGPFPSSSKVYNTSLTSVLPDGSPSFGAYDPRFGFPSSMTHFSAALDNLITPTLFPAIVGGIISNYPYDFSCEQNEPC